MSGNRYSTEYPAKCYVAAWMGEESRGEWIRVYVWLSHLDVQLEPSQHCFLAILQYKMKSFEKVCIGLE